MRWEACARTAVQRPWHYIARCFIALAVLAAFADGRRGSDVPAAASTDSAGGEREDVSRKIAIWRSRSGREATAAGSSDTVRLSTYRPRLHEAPLSAEEASARLRRWRAGVGKAPPTLSTQEGLQHDEPHPPSALYEVGDIGTPVQTASSDRLGAWRKRRVLAAPEEDSGVVGAARWTAAGDGKDWGRGPRAGEVQMRVLVCIPTMRRRNGVDFVGQVLAAVREYELDSTSNSSSKSSRASGDVLLDSEQEARIRAKARAGSQPASPAAARVRTRGTGGSGEERARGGAAGGAGSERVQAHVLVMHDEEDARPPGADYYMTRMKHEIQAPCGFMRWRRALVLDFVHMMQVALEIIDPALAPALAPLPEANAGAGAAEEREQEGRRMVDYVLWLEDDALLHQGWTQMLQQLQDAEAAAPACLTALHPVAILMRRDRVSFILNALLHLGARDFRPLDYLLGAICQESFRLGGPRAWFFDPPLVTHLGDAVLGTTKPQIAETRLTIHRPAAGEVLKCQAPGVALPFEFEAEGLVYDAEYSWRFFLGEEQRGELQKGLKISSPRSEEECSDSPAVRLGIQFFDLPPGSYEITFELLEEESDTSQVVSRHSVTFSVADNCPEGA